MTVENELKHYLEKLLTLKLTKLWVKNHFETNHLKEITHLVFHVKHFVHSWLYKLTLPSHQSKWTSISYEKLTTTSLRSTFIMLRVCCCCCCCSWLCFQMKLWLINDTSCPLVHTIYMRILDCMLKLLPNSKESIFNPLPLPKLLRPPRRCQVARGPCNVRPWHPTPPPPNWPVSIWFFFPTKKGFLDDDHHLRSVGCISLGRSCRLMMQQR